jgi:hypothetical protein
VEDFALSHSEPYLESLSLSFNDHPLTPTPALSVTTGPPVGRQTAIRQHFIKVENNRFYRFLCIYLFNMNG